MVFVQFISLSNSTETWRIHGDRNCWVKTLQYNFFNVLDNTKKTDACVGNRAHEWISRRRVANYILHSFDKHWVLFTNVNFILSSIPVDSLNRISRNGRIIWLNNFHRDTKPIRSAIRAPANYILRYLLIFEFFTYRLFRQIIRNGLNARNRLLLVQVKWLFWNEQRKRRNLINANKKKGVIVSNNRFLSTT